MKVLFSFVGHRDPVADLANGQGEGAVVMAARRFPVDEAVLWFVQGGSVAHSTTRPEAELTAEYLRDHVRADLKVHLVMLPLEDPTDYAGLLLHTRRTLQTYLRDRPDVESIVSISSGTSQQQACLLLLVAGGVFPNPTVVQVREPRFALEGERVRPISLTFLEEERLVARAVQHAAQGLFAALAEDLERIAEITLHPDRRRAAQAGAVVAQAYAAWDRFDYGAARSGLTRALAVQPGALGSWGRAVERQRRFLDALRAECEEPRPPGKPFLADTLWNARRCLIQGRYVDALVRAWRLIEGVGVARLWEQYGVDVLRPARSRDRAALTQVQQYRDRIGLALWNQATVYGALDEVFHDPATTALLSTTVRVPMSGTPPTLHWEEKPVRDLLDSVRRARNATPAAHGACPVEAGLAHGALQLAELAMLRLAGVDTSVGAHPLADLEAFSRELASVLR